MKRRGYSGGSAYHRQKSREDFYFFLKCMGILLVLALIIATNYPLIHEYGVFWEWKIGKLQAWKTIIDFWF